MKEKSCLISDLGLDILERTACCLIVSTFGEVASLDHKVLYYSVKCGAFVAQLFPCDLTTSPFTCNLIHISQGSNPEFRHFSSR